MSVSLPSKETTVIDAPEVREFEARFIYNYHVPDELVSADATNIPRSIVGRPTEFFDSDYIDLVNTRIPRLVRFDFSPVFIQNPTMELSDEDRRELTANRQLRMGTLLTKFYDKIIGEQEFVNDAFKVVNFTDQAIATKLYDYVSSSMVSTIGISDGATTQQSRSPADYQKELRAKSSKDPTQQRTPAKRVKLFNQLTPADISYDFIARAVNQPALSSMFFDTTSDSKFRKHDGTLDSLKKVSLKSQINTKVFDTIVKSALFNPTHTISSEMAKLAATSDAQQKSARGRPQQISQDDYMMMIDPIEISVAPTTTVVEAKKRVVGYVIDKYELLPNGDLDPQEPILLENQFSSTAVDFKVKYGSTYAYQLRTVVEWTMPAIIQEDYQLVLIKLLISSKPTRKVFIPCVETIAPPWPTDVDFVWNYETNKLAVTWTFPPNTQRDIKKFQIFRRGSIKEPFQLQKVHDFDDTFRGDPPINFDPEGVPLNLVEKMSSPLLVYIDPDFTKKSKFIYSLCSIDAHGFTSNYSLQMEVSFDRFANRLIKKLISISGSPKSYPNMNLNTDTFVDVMHHENGSRMKVYFTPEFLGLYDDQGKTIPILSTNQKGAEYRIQIINVDNQKLQSIDINVDDLRRFDKVKDDLFKRQGLKSVDPNRFQP